MDALQSSSKVVYPRKSFFRSSTQPTLVTSSQTNSTAMPTEVQTTTKQVSHPAPFAEELSTAKSPLPAASTDMALPNKAVTERLTAGRQATGMEQLHKKYKKAVVSKAGGASKANNSPTDNVKPCSKTPTQGCNSKTMGKKLSTQSSQLIMRATTSTTKPTPCKKTSPTLQKNMCFDSSSLKHQSSVKKGKPPSFKQHRQQPLPNKLDQSTASGESSSSPPKTDPLELKDFSKLNSRDKFRRVKMVAERKMKVSECIVDIIK